MKIAFERKQTFFCFKSTLLKTFSKSIYDLIFKKNLISGDYTYLIYCIDLLLRVHCLSIAGISSNDKYQIELSAIHPKINSPERVPLHLAVFCKAKKNFE